jgi:carboxyl-terminal processing protease
MKSLVLDLRQNGGGYLSAATALADEFLPDKQLIVFTKGEHEPRTDYFATAKGKFETGKLIVLIDETTASASEVVAGAIQDLDRGVVIGRRSFGKGLVQEQFNFGDGSALNLTIARYYTPLGRSIQRPYKMPAEKYFEEVSKRLEDGGETNQDSLQKAGASVKTSAGRTLYGGGGIMPDITVAIDTSSFNAYYYALRARGIITEFLFRKFADKYHPSSLKQLINEVNLDDEEYETLNLMAKNSGVSAGPKTIKIAREAINTDLRASLARMYFGDEAYFVVQNASDKAIARSLQELHQPN